MCVCVAVAVAVCVCLCLCLCVCVCVGVSLYIYMHEFFIREGERERDMHTCEMKNGPVGKDFRQDQKEISRLSSQGY